MQYSDNYKMKKPEGSEFYNIEDFNDNTDLIDMKIKELENARDSINAKITELKKYASDGKSAVASAVTEMGVSTETDATFSKLASGIRSIVPTLRRVADKVYASINGKNEQSMDIPHGELNTPSMTWNGASLTAKASVKKAGYVDGETSSNTTSITTRTANTVFPTNREQTIYSSGNRVYFAGDLKFASLGGNATAADVLSGKTFSSDSTGRETVGTMHTLRDYRYIPNTALNIRKRTEYTDGNGASQTCSESKFLTVYEGTTGYINNATNEHMILLSRLGNATADQVLEGATFTSAGCSNVATTGTLKVNNASFHWGWGNQFIIPPNLRCTSYSYPGYQYTNEWKMLYSSGGTTPNISQGSGFVDITTSTIGYYHVFRLPHPITFTSGKYKICFRTINYEGSGGSGSDTARYYLGLSTVASGFNSEEGAGCLNTQKSPAITNTGGSYFRNFEYDFTTPSYQITAYPTIALVHKQKLSVCGISIWKLS